VKLRGAFVGMLVLLLVWPSVALARGHHAKPARIVEMPVSFAVRNVNRSMVPCSSDGRPYAVRGHLVAARFQLARPVPAVTLYVHATVFDEATTWRFSAVPGYDYATGQARAGHASVTIDQLGYGSSDIPKGSDVCAGSQADVVHQVIGELRSGSYTAGGVAHGPVFAGVALAGFSFGSIVDEIEAHSFSDIQALVTTGWADLAPFMSRPNAQAALKFLPVCAQGGEPKWPGGPGGYAYAIKGRERDYIFNVDPRVERDLLAREERDPCGELDSGAQAVPSNIARLSTVKVPVLLVYGQDDQVIPLASRVLQRSLYSGSRDVTLLEIPNAGHGVMWSRTAPIFRRDVSRWLRARGF